MRILPSQRLCSPQTTIILLYVQSLAHSLDIKINNEDIDDPAQVLRSKFKKYLPELQENLEIPLRSPNQETIKESFLPKPRPSYHRGIRSKFRKDIPMLWRSRNPNVESGVGTSDSGSGDINSSSGSGTTTTTTTTSTISKSSSVTNNDFNDTDEEEFREGVAVESADKEQQEEGDEEHEKVSPDVTLHSQHSWVKDFLDFQAQQVFAMAVVPGSGGRNNNNNIQLKSSITAYEDSLNNPQDLKRWVRIIADKPITPEMRRTKNHVNNEIEIDIDEFINYLVQEQGFNPDDLQFLKLKNLDYGMGEIEQELNKLKDLQDKNGAVAKVIDIGGEGDTDDERRKSFATGGLRVDGSCLLWALTVLGITVLFG
ncbi:hypothetical protein KGF56_002704 [Candida oxycetoniae]|uniref:Uncharacterized protein n=1 Tax=Candida oxycetoniae TaxID=497107 RepID=A0AAI9SWP8_9ASCO|nr:uncharacterized protein KGF56_002704 [Candida oxycetoniae]KAI3404512.1 hypothetical protein KGF56_002704 [Candida oxycetoniae]